MRLLNNSLESLAANGDSKQGSVEAAALLSQTTLPTSLPHIPANLQSIISRLSEVQQADTEHQSIFKTFQLSTQSVQEAEKLKAQMLDKINQGKTRDTELEAELKELEKNE